MFTHGVHSERTSSGCRAQSLHSALARNERCRIPEDTPTHTYPSSPFPRHPRRPSGRPCSARRESAAPQSRAATGRGRRQRGFPAPQPRLLLTRCRRGRRLQGPGGEPLSPRRAAQRGHPKRGVRLTTRTQTRMTTVGAMRRRPSRGETLSGCREGEGGEGEGGRRHRGTAWQKETDSGR